MPLARSLLLSLLLLIWEAVNLELVYISGARLPLQSIKEKQTSETEIRFRNRFGNNMFLP